MRKEKLGQSSLVLRSKLPPHMRKVRFNLPGSHVREEAGSDKESAAEENRPEASDWIPRHVQSTKRLPHNRINNVHGLTSQRRTRFRPAKRRDMSANYTASLENEKEMQSARSTAVHHENIATTTTVAKCDEDYNKQKKSNNETPLRCGDCQRILKERDKFWGLESDSEEEEIKDFNEHVRRRSLRLDSRSFKNVKEKAVDNGRSYEGKRIAGRGTWATPAYVPPWDLRRASRTRNSSMIEKGWFGDRKGI